MDNTTDGDTGKRFACSAEEEDKCADEDGTSGVNKRIKRSSGGCNIGTSDLDGHSGGGLTPQAPNPQGAEQVVVYLAVSGQEVRALSLESPTCFVPNPLSSHPLTLSP
jgi:hypothetical protein